MATGLRKRFAVFKKPLSASPVSELCVLKEEDERVEEGGKGGDEEVHDDVLSESLSRSFSSISEQSSGSGSGEDESGHEHGKQHGHDRGAEMSTPKKPVEATNVGPRTNTQEESTVTPTQSPKSETKPNNFSASPTRVPSGAPPRILRHRTSTFSTVRRSRDTSSSSSSGSWLGYDLSIIVALVSPIGNILTGSDHIKNILLLLFLIYYLHQLIEVPWNLYRSSIPSEESFTPTEDTDPTRLAAYAELRRLEVFYLVLTVLSPFLGATLLRYVAIAISGDAATLSWFSTSLFVLATGIRPWTHLAERMKSRSRALKELVEEPEDDGDLIPGGHEDPKAEIDREILSLRGKYDVLDKRLVDLGASSSREWDDLADAIDAIELSVRKHQSETNKTTKEWDARLAVLETYVLDLHSKDRKTRIHEENSTYLRGARLRTLFWNVLALPWTATAVTWELSLRVVGILLPGLGINSSAGQGKSKSGMTASQFQDQTKFHPHVLETIVEEGPESQDRNDSSALQNINGGCVGSDSSQTLVAEATAISDSRQQYFETNILDPVFSLGLRLFRIAFAPLFFFIRVLSALVELPRSVLRSLVR